MDDTLTLKKLATSRIDNYSEKIIGSHSFFSNHLFVHRISEFISKNNYTVFIFLYDGFHLHFQFQKFVRFYGLNIFSVHVAQKHLGSFSEKWIFQNAFYSGDSIALKNVDIVF